MTEVNKIWLVGDKLKGHHDNAGIVSLSDLESFVSSHGANYAFKNSFEVIIGQGISDTKLNRLFQNINASKLNKKIRIKTLGENYKRTQKELTHKRLNKNTLISEPQALNELTYESYLMVDERCAEMSDHVTGQHIQGMVLIEAARQMTLAVTGAFFLDKEQRKNYGFISHSLNTEFKSYVFPLDVKIVYRIKEVKIRPNIGCKFFVGIEFIQSNEVKTLVETGFSAMDKKLINIAEKDKVFDTLNKFSNGLKNDDE